MRFPVSATVLLLALAFAGCTDGDKTATTPSSTGAAAQTNFITPDVWRVSAETDRILVWVHNVGTADVNGTWNLTLAGDGALPTGWTATFQTPTFALKPSGTKVSGPRGKTYPDWAWTLVTLKVPADTPAGKHDVLLHAGAMEHAAALEVTAFDPKVSGPGSKVTAQYDGKFSDGTSFDDGEFPTTLGSGQTVPGFDYGLMGLALHEKAKIVIPPAMGYGYDNPPGNYAKFNGQTLIFDVEIKALA